MLLVNLKPVYSARFEGNTLYDQFNETLNYDLANSTAHLDMTGHYCRGTGNGGCVFQAPIYVVKTREDIGNFSEFTGAGAGAFSSIPPSLHNSIPLLFRNASFNFTDNAGNSKKTADGANNWCSWMYEPNASAVYSVAVSIERIINILTPINPEYFNGVNEIIFIYSNKEVSNSKDGLYTTDSKSIKVYIYKEADSFHTRTTLHELKHHHCNIQNEFNIEEQFEHQGCFLDTSVDKEYGFVR